jgi:hypothetical protein
LSETDSFEAALTQPGALGIPSFVVRRAAVVVTAVVVAAVVVGIGLVVSGQGGGAPLPSALAAAISRNLTRVNLTPG